jgi:hypothetical protein
MEAAKNIKDIGEWNKYIQSLHSDNVKFFEGRKNAKNNVTPAQPTAKGAYPVDTGTTTPVPAVRKLKENGKLVSKTINTNNVDELIDAYKVTPEGKKKYGGPIKSIGGLDLQTVQYATNPDHMKSLRSIYADVKDFDYNQMQAEFKRLGSPLQYISGSLAKALEHYGLTPGEFIAVVRQDSRAIENKNPGNVGNVDNGSNLKFSTWLEGSVAAMRNLAERKVEG